MEYKHIFFQSFVDYWNYLIFEITHPSFHNYFYGLVVLSVLVFILEIIIPWRKKQPIIRKDFWLDLFYLFFNFFLFSLIIYNGLSNVAAQAFTDFLALFGIKNLAAIHVQSLPIWAQYLIMFFVADFIQWNVHRLLHRFDWLWKIHKVHHSVEQMGFAAHFRFHWLETIIYKSLQYLPLAMIGFGIDDFYIVHMFAIFIGHLNHANINIDYGPLKYIFNNPKMHIWHHAKELPYRYGVNFGISLSLWDYLFGTAYIPKDGKDIPLGFENVEAFPDNFISQSLYPFKKEK
ncbi:MAG: hypothetical protein Kow0079_09760 [Vicingaceae bacterium]